MNKEFKQLQDIATRYFLKDEKKKEEADPLTEAEKELDKFKDFKGASTDELLSKLIKIQIDLTSGIINLVDIAEIMEKAQLLIHENRNLYKKQHEILTELIKDKRKVRLF